MGEKEKRGGGYLVPRSGGTKRTLKGKNVWTVKKLNDFVFHIFSTNNSRPGHGAPTQDIRKKKFTEHQMNNLSRSQSLFGLDSEALAAPPGPVSR